MATTKDHKPVIDDDFLAGIKTADNVEGKKPATEPTPTRKAAEPSTHTENEKKILITAKVNETTLKAWKQFCLDHDTNLTAVIKSAMNHYIKDVQSGTIEI